MDLGKMQHWNHWTLVPQKAIGEFVCYFTVEAYVFTQKDLFPKYMPEGVEFPVEGFSNGTVKAESYLEEDDNWI